MQTIINISAIKKYNKYRCQFFFSVVEKEDIIKNYTNNPKKVTQETDIPVNSLGQRKLFCEICPNFL